MADTLYASVCEYIESYNATYATAVAGSNLSVPGGSVFITGQETSPQATIWAAYIAFDLTSYSAGGTASSPTLSLYLSSGPWNGTHTYNVRSYDFGASVTTGDWVASGGPGGTLRAHRSSSGVSGGYNAFTDDAMVAAIEANLGGTLRLWVGTSAHEAQSSDNKNTIWVRATGGANAPKLVFTYTAPSASGDPMGMSGFFGA